MAKGKNINGQGGGSNGGNESYTVVGRGTVSRAQMVRETEQGRHPDTAIYTRGGKKYLRNKPNNNIPDNINN